MKKAFVVLLTLVLWVALTNIAFAMPEPGEVAAQLEALEDGDFRWWAPGDAVPEVVLTRDGNEVLRFPSVWVQVYRCVTIETVETCGWSPVQHFSVDIPATAVIIVESGACAGYAHPVTGTILTAEDCNTDGEKQGLIKAYITSKIDRSIIISEQARHALLSLLPDTDGDGVGDWPAGGVSETIE